MTTYNVETQDLKLAQNYKTDDRMLRYKRIHEYFFMGTFFTMSKGGRSSWGNTCSQLFVTDKGYLYLVPMKWKSEVLAATKQFVKDVGAPEAIVGDMASKQWSSGVKQFCNAMGMMLITGFYPSPKSF